MPGLAIALVLLSSVAHGSWNFMLKRARNQEVFIWLTTIPIGILVLPVAIIFSIIDPADLSLGWIFLLGTILIHVFYYVFLARTYKYSDLSAGYPTARGTSPMLVPIIGVLVLHESVSFMAAIGIAMVVIGIYIIYWWQNARDIIRHPTTLFKDVGSRYALLTGLIITCYTIWDKQGVAYVNPIVYTYIMFVGVGIVLTPYMLRMHGASEIKTEWTLSKKHIVTVGLLMIFAYALVLSAMRLSQVSYVAPAREVGIVVGVILGIIILKEPFPLRRIIGSSSIVLGIIAIALAP